MNLEKAIRNKFRFPSPVGDLTLEQLWDLPLQSTRANRPDLDGVAKEVNRHLREQAEESFVETSPSPVKAELQEKLDIVVHIIKTLQAENAAARDIAAKRAQKHKLLEILAAKKDQDLQGKSIEELEAMIAGL